jgi:hypothetical protein
MSAVRERSIRVAGVGDLLAVVTFNVGWIAGDLAQRPGFSPANDDISRASSSS